MSKPSSTNARAAEAPTVRVRLEIADLDLTADLQAALRDQPAMVEAGDAVADLVVSDDAIGEGVVLVTAAGERTALGSRDPALTLAAARLLAAGFIVTPRVTTVPFVSPIHLSQREQQVAGLLLEGASNKLIARTLGISVHTAKFHVTAVLDKLGARNRADAVSIILREGLIAL